MFSDGSGNLVIKARLGSDIRRIPIHNEELTYDDLVLMMLRVFHTKLKQNDELLIKYTDDDGDLVTISDNGDLSHAKQYGRVLRLTLFVNGVSPGGVLPSGRLRAELLQLSTAVNTLMTKLAQLTPESDIADGGDGIATRVDKEVASDPAAIAPAATTDASGGQPNDANANATTIQPQKQPSNNTAALGASFDPLGAEGALSVASAPPSGALPPQQQHQQQQPSVQQQAPPPQQQQQQHADMQPYAQYMNTSQPSSYAQPPQQPYGYQGDYGASQQAPPPQQQDPAYAQPPPQTTSAYSQPPTDGYAQAQAPPQQQAYQQHVPSMDYSQYASMGGGHPQGGY